MTGKIKKLIPGLVVLALASIFIASAYGSSIAQKSYLHFKINLLYKISASTNSQI